MADLPLPIVQEQGDTDVYKETMRQAGMSQFPGTMARVAFQCRSLVDLRPFADEIREEINHLRNIAYAPEDLRLLGSKPWMKRGHMAYLKNFRLDPEQYVTVRKGGGESGDRSLWTMARCHAFRDPHPGDRGGGVPPEGACTGGPERG